MNIATTAPATAATAASEMSTEAKWVIVGGVVATIVALVFRFKLAAAVPFALAFGGITYVSFGMSGIDMVTGLFAALTIGVLFLGVHARRRAAAKAPAPAPAPAHA